MWGGERIIVVDKLPIKALRLTTEELVFMHLQTWSWQLATVTFKRYIAENVTYL